MRGHGEFVEKLSIESEHTLHRLATEQTGLTDFGESSYLDPLRRVLRAYEYEAHFTAAGHERAFNFLLETLIGRLYSQEGWKRYPECLTTPITRPLVITGLPRSGTTAVHKLLSVDPQFQGLEHWLARSPAVRPPREEWSAHPLYQRALASLEDMLTDQPVLKIAHGQAAGEVDECYNLLLQSFIAWTLGSFGQASSYDEWYEAQDETASYQRFRDNLRLIGFADRDQKWLLKNPNHIFAIDALLNVFPDALIVQMHRNPVEAIPSVSSLALAGRRYCEGAQTSPQVVATRHNEHWIKAVARAMRARERHRSYWVDVRFGDFLADPMSVVRRIYDVFDLTLAKEVEQAMQRWLAENPRGKHGEHRYSGEQFGLSEAQLRRQYQAYITEFEL